MTTMDRIKEDFVLSWVWLRNLLKTVEDYKDVASIIEKVQDSFKSNLRCIECEVFIVENPDEDRTNIDKLASANFFSRNVIEEIFLHKKPHRIKEAEIIVPLEIFGRILGLLHLKTDFDLSDNECELIWSFSDQLAFIINDIQLPEKISPQSKSQIKEISNSIFNNLKSFLEASLERLKVLEEQNIQLVELNRTRTELINNVSHELRTPLVSIMGFSKILQRHEIQPDLILEASDQIQSAGSRLSRMIDDLIQLNRASTKGWNINVEKLDIGEIAKFTVDSLSPLNTLHNFTFKYPESYPMIEGDRKLLRQVIENLLINAIKYSPEGGEINSEISLNTKDRILNFSISDYGIGMTEEEHSKIFERFYRAKNTKTENIAGLGLGLTICKDVVEALNGNISCVSNFGEGSIFTISFAYEEIL